jgi:hypothetical protein
MTAAAEITSAFQVVVGSTPGHASSSPGVLGCLGSLLVLSLLSILSYCILRVRSFLNRSGKEKPEFASLRSTGKTIVNAALEDEDDPDQFGGVN